MKICNDYTQWMTLHSRTLTPVMEVVERCKMVTVKRGIATLLASILTHLGQVK